MAGPWVFVGTKDYATGLMDASSLASAGSGFANSMDVSSFYALKTSIPSVTAFANSVDVSSFYALKTSIPSVTGYLSASSLAALMSGDAGFTSVGTLTIKGSQGFTATAWTRGAASGSGAAYSDTLQGENATGVHLVLSQALASASVAGAPAIQMQRSTGSLGAPAVIAAGALVFALTGFGFGATAYQRTVSLRGAVLATETPSDTAMGGQWIFEASPLGSATLANLGTWDFTSGLALATNIAYSKQRVTAFASGASLTVNNNTDVVVFTVNATRTTGTIIMPAAPVDGQIVTFAFGSLVITTLTLQGNTGQTIDGALSTAAANSFASYVWDATSSTWYRCG